jgi:hypothetical protein
VEEVHLPIRRGRKLGVVTNQTLKISGFFQPPEVHRFAGNNPFGRMKAAVGGDVPAIGPRKIGFKPKEDRGFVADGQFAELIYCERFLVQPTQACQLHARSAEIHERGVALFAVED